MKKEDSKPQPDVKKTSDETKKSLDNGKKIIEIQKMTAEGTPEEKEEKEKADAERWRNEG